MRNKKGQALIEFVIILPVMLLLVFCLIDFGMVIYEKNNLENIVSDAANLYEDGKQIDDIKKIIGDNKNLDINIKENDGYTTIEIEKSVVPITPGLNYLKNSVFRLKTHRVLKND